MPYISHSSFSPPFFIKNTDVQTILCHLLHTPAFPPYSRERIATLDNDFLDLDWIKSNNNRLVILSHGLEGSSKSRYILSIANLFSKNKWDVLAWNMRGCSGEPNFLEKSYHSGKWEDLELVVQHAAPNYTEIALVGFSIGGNITLHYLGSRTSEVPVNVRSAVTISVPCDLKGSAERMALFRNKTYMSWFLKLLRDKFIERRRIFSRSAKDNEFKKFKNFYDYDDAYTAPDNGFKGAHDYWEKASSLFVLNKIKIPTLLLNACDDSFLNSRCYPKDVAEESESLFLEIPKFGGHVGFWEGQLKGSLWSERRALEFILGASK